MSLHEIVPLHTSRQSDDIKKIVVATDGSPALRPNFVPTGDCGYRYNTVAAHLAALAAGWSYSDVWVLKERLTEAMQTELEVYVFEAHNPVMYLDTDAYLLCTKDPRDRFGILVFRGTELTDVADFLTDANVSMVDFPNREQSVGKVHEGFYEGSCAIWQRVASVLKKVELSELIIAGHSLGAALALTAVAQIHAYAEDEAVRAVQQALRGVYTFGQPAVGDHAFGSWLQDRCHDTVFRHVYGKDVVSLLPTADVNPAYRHLEARIWACPRGGELWDGSSERTQYPLGRLFLPALLAAGIDFVARRFYAGGSRYWTKLLPYSLDDHSPLHYLRVSRNSYLKHAPRDARPDAPQAATAHLAAE